MPSTNTNTSPNCEVCSSEMPVRSETVETSWGIRIHSDCYGRHYVNCRGCEEDIKRNSSYYDEGSGKHYCEFCYVNNFFYCEGCSTDFHSRNGAYNVEDELVCYDCYGTQTEQCDNCGESYWQSSEMVRLVNNEEMYLCERCHPDPSDSSPHIKNYSYKPRINPLVKKNEIAADLIGIELEVEVNRKTKMDDAANLVLGLFPKGTYLKSDSSIGRGFEIVTHPMSLDYIKDFPFREALNKLKNSKTMTSYKRGTCGLHIHISKSNLTKADIWNMTLFFDRNKSRIMQFSKRKGKDSFCEWRTSEQYAKESAKRKNPYAHKKIDSSGKMVIKCIKDKTNIAHSDRHVALNTQNNHGTVEFRIFRGTLGYSRFMASLQFVFALKDFVKSRGSAYFVGTNTNKMWTDFMMDSSRKGYGLMVKYFIDNRICASSLQKGQEGNSPIEMS